jgi:hypothetical protein
VQYADADDRAYAALAAAAATDYVQSLPIVDDEKYSDATKLGAVQLAVALYQRKPTGVAPDFDSASALVGIDPMLSRLLKIGRFKAPVVA